METVETMDLVNNNFINDQNIKKSLELANENNIGGGDADNTQLLESVQTNENQTTPTNEEEDQKPTTHDVDDINEIQSLTKEELIESWEPNQDEQYLNIDSENVVDRKRMRALLDQMRLMEKGIFDRDAKVKELEKLVEQLTLAQIGRPSDNHAGVNGYPDEASSTFQHHQTPPPSSHSHSRPSTPRRAIPKFIKRLSEYSLSFKSNRNLLNDEEDSIDVNVNDRSHHQHQNTPRSRPSTPSRASPSFWSRSTSMLSLLKWSSDDASSTTTESTVKNL
ncbi:hypothetical protein PPL_07166 [Heterostelium album PN500]|uniref:Uncharacterized protein n=1 Tax=Heterostelium pallidum (strain ATCC 26659 / Pp 5 / PN500) TaxID=670386 RepID=D3BEK2_HETP5|nr:hypothetical protein PPL_07166 [Heterostelium album PN500]EFA80333.1 hypothetical protein PPL_07166 [Heterostelium album PN500]|eukprot:XP_020432453.1 hypothetical protein PPL_07166 [Heterostelium album PN500]